QKGDWVELVDPAIQQNGESGDLYCVLDLPDFTHRQVTLSRLASQERPAHDVPIPQRQILVRWDQKESGTIHLEDGAVPFQPNTWVDLEQGVQVSFSGNNFQPGDYWLIPARVATGVEWPCDEQGAPIPCPPAGIQHHFSPLALLHYEH